MAAAMLATSGVPHPVTASQPGPAEYWPFEPVVMSWNTLEYSEELPSWYSSVGAALSETLCCAASCRSRAQVAAHAGAPRLVPPTWCHRFLKRTATPVFWSARKETSGTQRNVSPGSWVAVCHRGRVKLLTPRSEE